VGSNFGVLHQIPLEMSVRTGGDSGQPIVIAHPDGPVSNAFRAIARRIMAKLEQEPTKPNPKIQIEL
jgi:ATP-binding protein involved in chromosome partitioning